jgi:hypothetical protein
MKQYILKYKKISSFFIAAFIIVPSMVKGQTFTDAVVDSVVVTPINLTTFTASKVEKNVHLNWTTSTEKNNSHFLIQKSSDGVNFENIARVAGKVNATTTSQYSYTDLDVAKTNLYYRLQQVDLNGKSTLSNVVLIKNTKENTVELSVYPNPIVNENITLSFKNLVTGAYKISFINMIGETVLEKNINISGNSGATSFVLPSSVSKGFLVLKLVSSDGKTSLTQKIIVQ